MKNMLTEKEENISGINTDIISYCSESKTKILIFPGNPGIADLYKNFAELIIEAMGGNCCIYIIGYAGFTKKKPERHYTIQEETEHKAEVIHQLRKNWAPDSRIFILGHSIGSWIGMEVVKKFRKEMKIALILLFPFIAKSDNEIQKKFAGFSEKKRYYQFLLAGYKVFRKLLGTMLSPMIKFFYSYASEYALEIISEFFLERSHIPENIFYLANSEFHTLSYELDMDFFESEKKSVILFYCHEDMWAPVSQMEQLRNQIPDIRTEVLPLITHDFCVNSDQCRTVAQKVCESVQF